MYSRIFGARKKSPTTKPFTFDNHDDLGEHVLRNEFTVDGKFLVGYDATREQLS